ncbi:MAG TPA: hypothetical protein VHD32_11460 [Candidatus Didemnitutus sp.]|nr:hypothetical protein [Candidatus Didemnitutus sp.]
MADAFAFVVFLVDAVVVAAAGWFVARILQPRALGFLESALAWLLASILVVAACSTILGVTGGFGPLGFLISHSAILVVARFLRRHRASDDAGAWRQMVASLFAEFRQPGVTRVGLWTIGVLIVLLVGLAAAGEPLVYDALTYRLPRIAQWLQDGRVSAVTFDDQRLNFMSCGQDMIVAWLIGAFRAGFRLAALAQVIGGVLLIGATLGLARRSGLGKGAAVGAALLTFGFANLAPQWTSAHNDLFAAGVFASAFYLVWPALLRGQGSWLAGLGLAFALDAKGTVFYAGPMVAIWAVVLARRFRAPWRAWWVTSLAGAIGMAMFLGPPFARNFRLYGHLAGPVEGVREHYGPAMSATDRVAKLRLNLRTAAAQLMDPWSQPWGLRQLVGPVARNLADGLPERDPYSFEDLDRRGNVQYFLNATQPNADFSSFGLPAAALLLAGTLVGAFAWRTNGPWLFMAGGSVALFVLTENALLQWHPWEFRYAALVAPWLAIAMAGAIDRIPGPGRAVVWTLLLLGSGEILLETTLLAGQVGWQAWELPRKGLALGQPWRGWARSLGADTPDLRVALISDRPLAWLSRLEPGVTIHLESLKSLPAGSAEKAVAGRQGWLVVPAGTFMGREGRVLARTWLDRGDAGNDLSLAAYRSLRPGESPQPVLYRQAIRRTEKGYHIELKVRSWGKRMLLDWNIPDGESWTANVASNPGSPALNLGSGGNFTILVSTSEGGLSSISVDLMPAQPDASVGRPPVVIAIRSSEP